MEERHIDLDIEDDHPDPKQDLDSNQSHQQQGRPARLIRELEAGRR